MAKATTKVSKAPTGTEATIAAGQPEPNAVAVVTDAAATPPGFSVPGGTNTPESSGAAAGSASAELVKPQGNDDTSTPVNGTEATNSQPAPGAEAAAPGGNAPNPTDASQGAAEPGAGNPAGSGDTLTFMGMAQRAQEFAMRQMDVQEAGIPSEWALGEDIMRNSFPLTCTLLEGCHSATEPSLRIRSRTEGFRRAGIAHSVSGHEFPLLSLSPAQIEAFLGDPELTVEIVE